jgi:drug/metabolite transporter (DMT)-like permease
MNAAGRARGAASGYAMVAASYIIIGLSGTLVTWATAPASLLLVLRYAIAVAAILVVLGRPRRLRCLKQRDLWPRLVLMGFFDAVALLFYFYAVREAGVAIGTVFLFSQPVWIAILAPRFLKSRTEPVVYVAIGIALVGLGIILTPALSGSLHVSVWGLVAGLLSGWAYAGFALLVKDLTHRMDSAAMVLSECALDCLFLLPLALWQTLSTGYVLTARDLLVAVILGLVCTALAYSLWMEGVRYIRMQHSAVLGFLSPVAAPLFAWVLIGQAITVYTAVGGVLVLAAGILVVARGEQDVETEPPV